ncbi:MAG TPA: ribulokinase [Planctomycetes bacterium]|nr:ribulokinase [Planctomycetota bacterium]
MADRYSIGVDFGTNSVRSLVVNAGNGREMGACVFNYPSGEAGILLDAKDPNLARQHPADYIIGLEKSVRGALKQAKAGGVKPEQVVGIGVDTTGSTPVPLDKNGVPLSFHREFRKNLNAMAWLWKDHTSHAEAAEITEKARKLRPRYLASCGGVYSSEWYWSKILHCRRTDAKVFDAAAAWVEHADYMPAYLAGDTRPSAIKPGICPAGHKAMYSDAWGGYPDGDFLGTIDPALAELKRGMWPKAFTSDRVAGRLSRENAKKLGLEAGIPIACGAFDAHMGAVGAGVAEGKLVKVLGTSGCDMAVLKNTRAIKDVPGLCGVVDGSILPGYYGFEAGQSAVGDIFNSFVSDFAGGGAEAAAEKKREDLHVFLSRQAAKLRPGESGLLALDWHNGNRTILVDPRLSGLVMGFSLHSTAAEVYRALVEATAFGARVIIDRLTEYGVPIDEVICTGGIADKNPFIMQVYADVLGRPLRVARSAQTCALGAAVFGAVAGGAHPDTETARARMTGLKKTVYKPNPAAQKTYDRLFRLYRRLHDSFGVAGTRNDVSGVMKDLLAIKADARR